MNFISSIAPSPAGPRIIEITRLGINGSCMLKTKIAIAQAIAPSIACSTNFFNTKNIIIDTAINTIPAINTLGFIAIATLAACSAGKEKLNPFANSANASRIIVLIWIFRILLLLNPSSAQSFNLICLLLIVFSLF
jgi:hypothetical protein